LVPPLARAALIKTLADLPEGEGLAVDDLTARLVFDNVGLMAPAIVNQLVNEARVLGLVPGDGPVGLTPSGRMLLAGIQALETMTGGGPRQFTVQPDHTIIAPPDLDAEVIADLERFTSLESEAGALIYRITTEDTVRALDSGWTADEILEFLAQGSSVPVAQNVARTITDAADRHGRITVGSSATWVACDDSVLLANAVAVKSAKLVAVNPTLAVSELPPEKVLAALRARGLAPREQSSGEPESAPTPSYLPAIELRDRLLPNSDDIAALAARVMQGEEPAPVDDNWETELMQFIQRSGGDV
jgi:Helicase conserved C-terminal domain